MANRAENGQVCKAHPWNVVFCHLFNVIYFSLLQKVGIMTFLHDFQNTRDRKCVQPSQNSGEIQGEKKTQNEHQESWSRVYIWNVCNDRKPQFDVFAAKKVHFILATMTEFAY